jgi:hypothetical protein
VSPTSHRKKQTSSELTTSRSDCDYKSTIDVLVGSQDDLFVVYKDVICVSSKFFKAACSQRWVGGKEKKVRLPEVEPKIFQSYVAWLYSGDYQMQACREDAEKVKHSALDAAIELYLLGDILDDICFRNKMMDVLVCHDLKRVPSTNTLRELWKRTPPTSPLRKMYIDRFILRVNREGFAQNLKGYPQELVQEIALSSLKRLETKTLKAFTAELVSFLEPVPEDDA